jgi:hypothetical protein
MPDLASFYQFKDIIGSFFICGSHCEFEGHLSEMKNRVFWDVTPCGSCKNRRFGGT